MYGAIKVFFQCINAGSLICGPKGHLEYEASDGSLFKLDFDCPIAKANYCGASVSENSPFQIKGDVAERGADITYVWLITQKHHNEFVDMPVSTIDLLNAEKCNLLSLEQILKYIDNREYVRLKDVFEIKDMPVDAKLWCIKNNLFLTAQTKAIITRALADKIKDKFAANDATGLYDRAYEYNLSISQNVYGLPQGQELHSEVRNYLRNNINDTDGISEDISMAIIDALCNENLSKGCSNAIDLYTMSKEKNVTIQRKQEIISIVEKLL